MPGADGTAGRPIAFEVKHSADSGFLLSVGEWNRAKELSATDAHPAHYAVLVVRRPKRTDEPTALHMLEDPWRLEQDGLITLCTDTFKVPYIA